MPQWLYDLVALANPRWEPAFARQSTVNWMRALDAEIRREHGDGPEGQYGSCTTHMTRERPVTAQLANVFEPLYASLTYAMSLTSATSGRASTWTITQHVVSWYYCNYMAFRSMLAAAGEAPPDTHAKVARMFAGNLRARLPHPFDMVAERKQGECYVVSLPTHPTHQSHKLTGSFADETARGMLLRYLAGTAKWETQRVKAAILRENVDFTDFRGKTAKAVRDERLPRCITFMTCAQRYRGKANYRDALFLTYGGTSLFPRDEYLAAIAGSARFVVLLALAWARAKIGSTAVKQFVADVDGNLGDVARASDLERFWQVASK